MSEKKISRRRALKFLGTGAMALTVASTAIGKAAEKADNEDGRIAYRPYGNRHMKVSLLGFGAMRFPTMEGGLINEVSSEKMIDYAYAHGVNYFDTAWVYHKGASEGFIGGVLAKYPRESFYLADKMPTWLVTDLTKAKEIFQTQLDRCGVTYFDNYLLHSLESKDDFVKVYEQMGVLEYLKEEKAAGRIRNLGFSFHGDNASFDYIIDKYDWDFVQIQLNYFDWYQDNSKYLYEKSVEKNIPIVVMEPIRGGMLAKLNPDAEAALKAVNPDESMASWALRWVASLPGIFCILSGMTAMEHVTENVATLSDSFRPLNAAELSAVYKALSIFLKTKPIRCTSCRYCMPCSFGVDIPRVFKVYNTCVNESNIPEKASQSPEEFARRKAIFLERYNAIPAESRADICRQCGKCERLCPQHLNVGEEMQRIVALVKSLD